MATGGITTDTCANVHHLSDCNQISRTQVDEEPSAFPAANCPHDLQHFSNPL